MKNVRKQSIENDIGVIAFDNSSDIDNVKAAKCYNFPHFCGYNYYEVDTYIKYF